MTLRLRFLRAVCALVGHVPCESKGDTDYAHWEACTCLRCGAVLSFDAHPLPPLP